MNEFASLPLQLFAEAGDMGVSAPTAQVQGVKQSTADPAQLPAAADPDAAFEKLIRGEFKQQYNARVQDIVQKRLKNHQQTLEQYKKLEPSLEILAKKYGVEAKDLDALSNAIAADSSPSAKPDMQQQARQQYDHWVLQTQQAKQLYPNLEISQEMKNPRFRQLLLGGASVDEAYLVVHRDHIIPEAMRYTAATVEQKLANRIASNGARPTENGMSAQGTAVMKQDVSRMSKAQRQDIIRRVRLGETIRF